MDRNNFMKDWRSRKRDNGLRGKRRGAEQIQPDIADVEKLRKALDDGSGDFKYQELIDHWWKAFGNDHAYQEGSHIKPINSEGEES